MQLILSATSSSLNETTCQHSAGIRLIFVEACGLQWKNYIKGGCPDNYQVDRTSKPL